MTTYRSNRIPAVLLFAVLLCLFGCLQWEYEPVDFLELETGAHDLVNSNSIEIRGFIDGLRETIVTEHGHCWSAQHEEPIIENDPHTAYGIRGGNGMYISRMEGLTSNQTYHVRAYAVWQGKIFYGNTLSIISGAGVSSDSVQYLAGSQAVAFGSMELSADWNTIIDQGYVWSLDRVAPTLDDHRVSAQAVDEEGRFYVQLDDLPIGSTVFLRAYNLQDNPAQQLTAYGKTISIITTPADVWVQRAPFPGGFRWFDAVSFVIDGQAYVGTGLQAGEYKQDFWRYDPIRNVWQSIQTFKGRGRSDALAFVIDDNAYVGLGDTESLNDKDPIDFWKYDPAADNWSQVPGFAGGYNRRSVAFTLSGRGFVIDRKSNDLWQYDPLARDWLLAGAFDGFANRYDAVGFVLDNEAYVTTGAEGQVVGIDPFRDFWKYQPEEQQWTQMDDFPGIARYEAVAVTAIDRAYVGLGKNGLSPLTDFWEFKDGNWTQKAAFGGGLVESVTAFAIADRVYVHALDGSFWVYIPE